MFLHRLTLLSLLTIAMAFPASVLQAGLKPVPESRLKTMVLPQEIVVFILLVMKDDPPPSRKAHVLMWSFDKNGQVDVASLRMASSTRQAKRQHRALSRRFADVVAVPILQTELVAIADSQAAAEDAVCEDLFIVYVEDEDGGIEPHTLEVGCAD